MIKLFWFLIIERQMRALHVVEIDSLSDSAERLLMRKKAAIQAILKLQDAIDPFCKCVVIGIANLAHTGADVMVSKLLPKGMTGVLGAMITVKDETVWAPGHLSKRHVKRSGKAIHSQRVAEVKAHDAAGKDVCDEHKVTEADISEDVGNVTDPRLVGCGYDLRRQQVVTAPEAGPGRTMGTPHSWHQQVALTQQGKEPVPTDVDALLRQSVRQFFPELARPHAAMPMANRLDSRHDGLGLRGALGLAPLQLIVCLATDAKVPTELRQRVPLLCRLVGRVRMVDDLGPKVFLDPFSIPCPPLPPRSPVHGALAALGRGPIQATVPVLPTL